MPSELAAEKSRQRRSQRVILSIPVTVSGQSAQGPFAEDTKTLIVNAHGALITMAEPVELDAELLIRNRTHAEPMACRVVYLGPNEDGRTQVGIEFAEPAPHFWNIAFPSEDWLSSKSRTQA